MKKVLLCLLSFIFLATPVFADKAYDAYKSGDYKTAFELFIIQARAGDVIAAYYVGYMYDEGLGVPEDHTKAVEWYRKSADKGYGRAQASMGWKYREGEGVPLDYNQALYWYQKSADNGDKYGYIGLGYLYETGKGVAPSKTRAIQYYRKAAELGEKYAIDRLAVLDKEGSTRSVSPYTEVTNLKAQSLGLGNYHAIVIGNNDYQYMPRLATAVNDARAVASLLEEKYGFRVRSILNGTRSQILSAILNMRQELAASDNLLIYYAGHGIFDEQIERGYWLPVDAERNNKANWIPNEDITGELRAIEANHILIVADSCYSGTMTRGVGLASMRSGPSSEWVRRMARRRSRTVLSSGSLEPVLDSGGGGHSIFARAFLTTLRQNKEVIVMDDLYNSIRSNVIINARQTPLYSTIRYAGHDNGDFVLVPR